MLTAALLGLLSFCVSAEQPNLITDKWNFEHNDIAQLGTITTADEDGYYASSNENVVITEGGANGSGHCLKVFGGNHGNGQYLQDLKPDTRL